MSMVHPEDLLDREADGTLDSAERAHLNAHLVGCSACRMERMLRADFAAELGPRMKAASVQDLVTGALSAAQRVEEPAPRARSRRWSAFAFVATMLIGSGLALAQTELGARMVELARVELGFREPVPAAAPPAKVRHKTPASHKSPPQVIAPMPVPQPEPVVVPQAVPKPRVHGQRAHKPSVEPQRVPEPSLPRAEPEVTASSLFDRANTARRAGRRLEASGLYRELAARFAGSPEATLSQVLLSRLLLDGGEAQAALSGFEAYLATGHGALREQAMSGRVEALRRLRRSGDEQRALDELLLRYPDSPYGRLHGEHGAAPND